MKKISIIIILVLALVSTAFSANSIDQGLYETLKDLAPAQQAELLTKAAEMKKNATTETPAVSNPKKVNEWVEVGKNLGTAIASGAKELGIAADSFLDSKTGRLLAIVIIIKVLGPFAVHVIFGTFLLIVGLILWVYFFKRLCVIKKITISKPTEGKFNSIKEVEHYKQGEVDDTRVFMFLVLAASIIFSVATIFTW